MKLNFETKRNIWNLIGSLPMTLFAVAYSAGALREGRSDWHVFAIPLVVFFLSVWIMDLLYLILQGKNRD